MDAPPPQASPAQEVPPDGGSEDQGPITPETLAAIKAAIGATGIAVGRAYEELNIPDKPIDILMEMTGLEVLAWYKKNA